MEMKGKWMEMKGKLTLIDPHVNLHTTGVHYLGGVSFFKIPKRLLRLLTLWGGLFINPGLALSIYLSIYLSIRSYLSIYLSNII